MIRLSYLTLVDIIVFIIMVWQWPIITNTKINYPNYDFYKRTTYIWISTLIFCIFAGWDTDYLHYYLIFEDISTNPEAILTTHLELVYIPIIKICCGNYTFFRIIIWGLALFFLIKSLKILHLSNNLSAIIFVIFNLLYFSYARVSLGITIYIYGLLTLYTGLINKKPTPVITGLIFSFFSLIFHKSVIFLLILLPITFVKFSNKKLLFTIITFPIFISLVYFCFFSILSNSGDGDIFKISQSAGKFDSYGQKTQGLISLFISFMEYSTYLYGLLLTFKRRKYFFNDRMINALWNLTIGLAGIALSFSLLNLGYIFSRRILLLSYIPLFFVLSYLFSTHFHKKEYLIFSYFAITYSSLKLIYYFYINTLF